MIVTRSNFDQAMELLVGRPKLSVDTETTGLEAYKDDRLFSIIVGYGVGDDQACYFNFKPYLGLDPDFVLDQTHRKRLEALFSVPSTKWYLANAKYDLAILAKEGIEIAGDIHDVLDAARVLYNDDYDYSLDAVALRALGVKKDNRVREYIDAHKLKTKKTFVFEGREIEKEFLHYDRVPFDLIVPYGIRDGVLTYRVGLFQEGEFERTTREMAHVRTLPPPANIHNNDRKLVKAVYAMERRGLLIDRKYCERATHFEADQMDKARASFKQESGAEFKDSPKLYAEIFKEEKEKWAYTDKGNPSFESDVLKRFDHLAARAILEYRAAKARLNFYTSILYYADRDDVIHPNLNISGTRTGRFSSSNPNFQNLSNEEDEEELAKEFVVRRAIIPRPGHIFIMPDYDQMEYRMMFDYACDMVGRQTEIVRRMLEEGLDPHQATADAVTALGTPLERKKAKNGNFAILYGAGLDTLAATIKASRVEAQKLKTAIFLAAPEMPVFTNAVAKAARERGYITSWAGRRFHLADPNFAYKMPNALIQGGTADVVKFAMVKIDQYLQGYRSRMVLQVHDELPTEVHEKEVATVPRIIKETMESIYPHKYLPLTAGMEWSDRSLADKVKGFPV